MDESNRIDSWKQIAAYLDKSERTVRRWYSLEGLPVHKHLHQERGSVWAYKSEIVQWLESRKACPVPLLDDSSPAQRSRSRLLLLSASLIFSLVAASAIWFNRLNDTASVSEPEVFTALPGMAYSPAISPDGMTVAFFWQGQVDTEDGIYLKKIGAESSQQLVAGKESDRRAFVYNPAWSPDGSMIAYLRRPKSQPSAKTGSLETELALVDSSGGNKRRLIRLATGRVFYANSHHLSWSRDGKRILAPMADGPRRGIFWIPLDGSEPVQLTDAGQNWEFAPSLSPNGDSFFFFRTIGSPQPHSEQMVYQALNQDGTRRGPETIVYSGNTMTSGLAWMPSGKSVVYCREDKSISGSLHSRLYRLSIEAGTTPIALGLGPCSTLSIGKSSSDGQTLMVYGSGGNVGGSIWSGSLHRMEELRKLVPSSRFQGKPSFSPDGAKLAFVSNRGGRDELWVCDRDGSNPRRLTSGSYIATEPFWSPDGTRILYGITLPIEQAGNPPVPHRLFSVLVSTGVSTQVPLGTMQACDPFWGPGGEIYFWTFDELWRAHTDGSGIRKLGHFRNHVSSSKSADGRYLFYARRTNPYELHRLDLNTGLDQLIADQLYSASFSISARNLYFVDSKMSLMSTPLEGGPTIKIASLPVQRILQDIVGLSVSADDSAIAYSLSDLRQLDLMLVRNFR